MTSHQLAAELFKRPDLPIVTSDELEDFKEVTKVMQSENTYYLETKTQTWQKGNVIWLHY